MYLQNLATFVAVGIISISFSNPVNAAPRSLSTTLTGAAERPTAGDTDGVGAAALRGMQDNQLGSHVNISNSQVPNEALRGQLPNSSTPRVASLYLGIWDGIGTQYNPTAQYTMLIAITEGVTGSVIGTIAYPSERCGGVLTLLNEYTNSIRLLETITYGTCLNNGIVTLQRQNNNTLQYSWINNSSPVTATGTLMRFTR